MGRVYVGMTEPRFASIACDGLFVLPSPDAIRRFVGARDFQLVASGAQAHCFRVFLAGRTAPRSGGTCLFLAELVFDAQRRSRCQRPHLVRKQILHISTYCIMLYNVIIIYYHTILN